MARRDSRAPTQRQLRVGEEIRHALAWMLEKGEVHDPGLHGASVTVTEVRVSPDLKNATAFVVPLTGSIETGFETADVVAALNRASAFLRHLVAKRVRLRFIPRLTFEADTSFDTAGRIDRLLHDPRVARDLEAPGEEEGEPDEEKE